MEKKIGKYHNELHRHWDLYRTIPSFSWPTSKASLIGLQGYGSDCRDYRRYGKSKSEMDTGVVQGGRLSMLWLKSPCITYRDGHLQIEP